MVNSIKLALLSLLIVSFCSAGTAPKDECTLDFWKQQNGELKKPEIYYGDYLCALKDNPEACRLMKSAERYNKAKFILYAGSMLALAGVVDLGMENSMVGNVVIVFPLAAVYCHFKSKWQFDKAITHLSNP